MPSHPEPDDTVLEYFDHNFVATAVDRTESCETDDGIVVFDKATRKVHQLNTVAALIWLSFDGQRTIGDVAALLASETGLPVDQIEADVVAAAQELAVHQLLEGFGVPGHDHSTDAPETIPGAVYQVGSARYVVPPSSCGTDFSQYSWEQPFAVEVGSVRLGVRTNHAPINAFLLDLFAAHLVDDPEAPINYSLVFNDEPGSRLNLLYHGCVLAGRSRGARRLVEMLDAMVGAYASDLEALPTLRYTTAFTSDGAAALVSDRITRSLDALEARLSRDDIHRSVRPPLVDLERRCLVVPSLVKAQNPDVGRAIEALYPTPAGERALPMAGEYALSGWIMPSPPTAADATGADPGTAVTPEALTLANIFEAVDVPTTPDARIPVVATTLHADVDVVPVDSPAAAAPALLRLLRPSTS